MATNTQVSYTARNAEANALSALLNNGYLRIYSGTQPVDANTALSGNTLLCELRFNATAAPSASNGVLTFNSIAAATAVATGTATFYRCLESDGSTVVMDGNISTSGANMNIGSTSIVSGAQVSITSFQHTVNPN